MLHPSVLIELLFVPCESHCPRCLHLNKVAAGLSEGPLGHSSLLFRTYHFLEEKCFSTLLNYAFLLISQTLTYYAAGS